LKTLIYLHGFISSPASRKALLLGDYIRGQAPALKYVVPALHHRPAQAVSQVQWHCLGRNPADLTLVGSSLGGFYATVVAEKVGCRAAVINPAVHPQHLFARHIGPQENLYTKERFEVTAEHVAELAALDPPAITRPGRYWLLAETGDEVLDYREAVSYYDGAFHSIVEGGDHTLQSFPEFVPDLVAWALGEDAGTTSRRRPA
jgi:predicted esterase YcpF (UPF0227 family)